MHAWLLSHISKLMWGTLLQALRDAHLGLGQQADTLTSTLTVCGYYILHLIHVLCDGASAMQYTSNHASPTCLDGV